MKSLLLFTFLVFFVAPKVFYNFKVRGLEGETIEMSNSKGKQSLS